MAKISFRTGKDGNGRVRFFVDGGECLVDEYVAKHVKATGEVPDVPVGPGGRSQAEADAEESKLRARLARLEAKKVVEQTKADIEKANDLSNIIDAIKTADKALHEIGNESKEDGDADAANPSVF